MVYINIYIRTAGNIVVDSCTFVVINMKKMNNSHIIKKVQLCIYSMRISSSIITVH